MSDPGTVVILLFNNPMPKVAGASKLSLFADDAKWQREVRMI